MSKRNSLKLAARTYRLELDTFLTMCEAVATPRAITCYMLAAAEEWAQYLDLPRPDPESDSFADDYLVTECMSKNVDLPRNTFASTTKEAALTDWLLFEDRCRDTNRRIKQYCEDGIPLGDAHFEEILTKMISFISSVLGPLNRAALEYAERHFQFGPGATSSCRGRDVLLSKKMTSVMDVSPYLYPFWRSVLGPVWSSNVPGVNLVASERLGFAKKNAKRDRVTCIQPHLNIFVQLGQGKLLRKQLLGAGLDLTHQADANRLRAKLAHKVGDATIDLKGASECISRDLVWLLFPVEWASFLDLSRVEYTTLPDGTERRLEKWSATGNGYTFELETLIFWAAARALDEDAVAFGDDIIIKAKVAPDLIRVLDLLGFSTNQKKTCLAGTFFESCGHDYWRGHNVRPIYFRGGYHDFTSAVIRIANKIRRYASLRNLHHGCDIRFRHAWVSVTAADRSAQRTGVPLGVGDDGLVRNFDEATPPALRASCRNGKRRGARRHLNWCPCPRCQHSGFGARVWRLAPVVADNTAIVGAYVAALAWGSPFVTRSTEYIRGRAKRGELRVLPVLHWEEIGPWC